MEIDLVNADAFEKRYVVVQKLLGGIELDRIIREIDPFIPAPGAAFFGADPPAFVDPGADFFYDVFLQADRSDDQRVFRAGSAQMRIYGAAT